MTSIATAQRDGRFQPSTINHQPSTINHQPSTINHQPSTINHQPQKEYRMKRKTGRNELAREVHFRKAGPTEKTGREKAKEQRREDKLQERDALLENQSPERQDSPSE